MSRKTCATALIVLTIALILIPGVHAGNPIENIAVVQDLPDEIVAGNTYEMIITFDNVAQESVPFIVEITVTCEEAPLDLGEVLIEEIKLNGNGLTCIEDDPGFFITVEVNLDAESSNELSITVSSLINLMPGTYDFDIVLGSEVEPEPELETGTLSISTTPVDGEVIVNGDSWGIVPAPRVVEVGAYTVTFGAVTGYNTPAGISATVVSGEITQVVGVYEIPTEPGPPIRGGGSPNKKPVADAGSDHTVYFDETVIFDGSGSYDPDGSIMSYEWDFGDGKKATGATVSHVYSDMGSYTVTLTVKDYKNAEASDTCIVTVTEEEKPTPPKPEPADFIIFNLAITPAEVEPGEEVTITFNVTNVGEVKGTCTVTLSVEGEPTTFVVTLEGGKSEKLEHQVSKETEGTYQVVVDSLTGSFEVRAPPIPLRPAEFSITDLKVSPTEVSVGDPVTVSVKIKNTGEETGKCVVVLKTTLGDESWEVTNIHTVAGGESETSEFTLKPNFGGTYAVDINGLPGSFTVTALPQGIAISPGYVAGILILIIIAGTTVYQLYRGGRLTLTKSPPGS
ncbi:MAG: PKD domain-containing protein [Proteobacteria bacterium]|nr:PKD domain-containing protein [Pseudomonadota bacterium]